MALEHRMLVLAGNCGIDARNMTKGQLKAAYIQQTNTQADGTTFYFDQHDMRLQEALGLQDYKWGA